MSNIDTPQYIDPNILKKIPESVQRKMAEAAGDLAGSAYRQHDMQIEWAFNKLKDWLETRKAALIKIALNKPFRLV